MILTIRYTKSMIEDNFFTVDGHKVSNLTAIVGENGTGKTSLLDAIIRFNEYRK